MRFKFRISNYRNSTFNNPIELEIKEGITFILGPNNIGKSNLIKFLHDIRPVMLETHERINDVTYESNLPLPFDQVTNRTSGLDQISFDLVFDDSYYVNYIIQGKVPNHHSVSVKKTAINFDFFSEVGQKIFKETRFFFKGLYFIGPLRSPNSNTGGNSLDAQIGRQFLDNWSNWSDTFDIGKMKSLELLSDELATLFGYKKFDIRLDTSKSNFFIKTDDGQFSLNELGNGFSQFIISITNVLMKSPSYIVIDEPETGLHPKMQEIFVRALASKSKFGLLGISHSIALARSTGDYIYALYRNESKNLILSPYGQHYTPTVAQSINEMSYSQFVEIGGNNILLVEGRTDIKVYREILRKYGIENKFIIMALGGGEFILKDKSKILEELREIKRLNPRSVCVIFDSEKTNPAYILSEKQKAFKEVCESLGFKVFATDRHSTENYLSQEAINKTLGNHYTALGQYQSFNSISNKWPKEKNWLVVIEMKKKDFEGTELDSFIQQELIPVAQ